MADFGLPSIPSKNNKKLLTGIYVVFAFTVIFAIGTIISFLLGAKDVTKTNTTNQSDANLPSNNPDNDNYTPPSNTKPYVFNVKAPITLTTFALDSTFEEKDFKDPDTKTNNNATKLFRRPSVELDALGTSVAMTKDASNIISSFPEFKANGFAQVFQNVPKGSNIPKYVAQEIKLTALRNTINIGPCRSPVVDKQSLYIGAISNQSITFSLDGTQMYIAVLTPNGTKKVGVTSPFETLQGKVLLYQRTSQINLQTGIRESNSNQWIYQCNKPIQTADLSRHISDFQFVQDKQSQTAIKGDQFGQVLKSSTDWRTRRRCITARKLYPVTSLLVLEENLQNNTFDITDNLTLLTDQVKQIYTSSSEILYLQQTFGYEFDIANNVLLVACQTSTSYHIAFYFKTQYSFEFVTWLDTPNTNERFGHSIKLRDDGKVAVIGSPSTNTNGGSVYIYNLESDNKTWTKRQTLNNLDSSTYNYGVFGAKVNMDSSFRILSILLNVSLTNENKINLSDGQQPTLLLLYYDNPSYTIVTATKQYIKGPTTDQMWGFAHDCQVQNNASSGTVKIAIGSPLDKKLIIYTSTANTS